MGIFSKKSGPLASCKVSEKTNKPIPRKLTVSQKDGQKDGQKGRQKNGQTLFYRTLPGETGGPIN